MGVYLSDTNIVWGGGGGGGLLFLCVCILRGNTSRYIPCFIQLANSARYNLDTIRIKYLDPFFLL